MEQIICWKNECLGNEVLPKIVSWELKCSFKSTRIKLENAIFSPRKRGKICLGSLDSAEEELEMADFWDENMA